MADDGSAAPFITVNGTRLYYERHGTGEPLLLITGFAISSAVFEPVLERYTRRFECILYDNRGAGRSEVPRLPTSMPELAADAAGLLRALGIASAHVYGLSMGGMIAQELALRFPQRVRGLILGATTPGGPRAFRPAARELASLGGVVAGHRSLAGALFTPEFRRAQPERTRELLRYFGRHRVTPRGALSHLTATVYHDTVSRLGAIRAPTLVLHGDRDVMAPLANARLLAERIPDAELAIIRGAGHAYALERPEAAYAALAGWLDRRGPIAAGAPRVGLAARAEPLTRALGLPIGAVRTGASLAGLAADQLRGSRSSHAAADG